MSAIRGQKEMLFSYMLAAAAIAQSSTMAFAKETIASECVKTQGLRSLVQTQETEVSKIENWTIVAKQSLGQVSCRATGIFSNGDTLTLIYDPTGKYRGGKWFFNMVSHRHELLSSDEEPAQLFLDQKAVKSGRVLAVHDWAGDEKTSSYVRAEFPNIDSIVRKIRAAQKIEIRVKTNSALKIKVPRLKRVLSELSRCHKKASGPGSPKFWEAVDESCG